MPALNALATKAYDASRTYGDVVHIAHVYVMEPHPLSPEPSPYLGVPWEMQYSTKPQAYTYDERKLNAMDIAPLLQGNQRLILDDLRPNGPDNPVWCTYGPCPNCAFLITQDGTIGTIQGWFDATDMENAIDALPIPPGVPSASRIVWLAMMFLILLSAFGQFMRVTHPDNDEHPPEN